MSSSVAVSKLIKMIEHGLPFHRNRGAIKSSRCVLPRTQSSLFRSVAQQQVQAGISRAPEPEYVPAHIVQDLLETVPHQTVAPIQYVQDLDGTMKHNGASTAQEASVPVTETTTEPTTKFPAVPAYFRGVKFDPVPYWQKIGRWKDTTEKQFLSYRWGVRPMHLPPGQSTKLIVQ
jgi:lysine 2,3-aminomutase